MSELSDSIRHTLISCEVKAGDIGLVTQIFDDLLALVEAVENAYFSVECEGTEEIYDALTALKVRTL
jgi:hypothetical protein